MISSSPVRPIGVFDSGVGGFSVLRALRAELPHEHFVYVADSGHAPYGERDDDHVIARSHAIADHLIAHRGIKALVVACNTATAAAIAQLRHAYATLPIVGIEPALKPAASQSRTGTVGVMATRGTLQSEKFGRLLESLHGAARFVLQPCDGLAIAIERGDQAEIAQLCARYTQAMGRFGTGAGEIDTLVLGCTHYPFAQTTLARLVGPETEFLEGGVPVARQTHRLLQAAKLLEAPANSGGLELFTTGAPGPMQEALRRWMGWDVPVQTL